MKFKALLAAVLALPLALAAQTTNPSVSVMGQASGPAEVAGQLYAANFAHWTASPTAEGLRWGNANQCYATSGGITFPMFATNAPIKVVDIGVPSNSETVTPSFVSYQGNGCSVALPFTHPHTNYYLQSGTLGLQEAANWSGAQYATILVTPDWASMGGTTAMINAVVLGANTTVQDERSNIVAFGSALSPASYAGLMGSFVGTSGSADYMQVVCQDLNPQGSCSWIAGGDDMTNTTHYLDISKNGSGSSRTQANVFFNNADATSLYTTDSELDIGAALVTGTGVINFYLAGYTTANMSLVPAGLTLTTGTATLPNGIVGVTGGGAASAGIDGQVISALVSTGSGVSIATSGTAVNMASVSLTAGDWDVEGSVNFVGGSTTIAAGALHEVGLNTTTATLPVDGSEVYVAAPTLVTTSANFGTAVPRKVYNVSSTTTVYLVANGTFTAGTEKVYGTITARRIR